jgi:hypothetical protein
VAAGITVLGLTLALLGAGRAQGAARAAQGQAGPIVFKNTSGATLTIKAESYVDASGETIPLEASWKVGPKAFSYLLVDGKKVTAQKFSYKVTTPEGTTTWDNVLTGLDEDGDYVVHFTADNLAEHRRAVRPARLPAGPLVFKNNSGAVLTIEAESIVDERGKEVSLKGRWDLKARFFGYLTVDGKKVAARQLKYKVITPQGTSSWTCDLRALDADGDFVVTFSEADYRQHLELAVPAGPAPGENLPPPVVDDVPPPAVDDLPLPDPQ